MTEDLEEQEDPGGSPSMHPAAPAVTVENEQSIDLDVEQVRVTTTQALGALGVRPDAALTITLVDEARIAELKQQALGVHAATDVLTFPMDDPLDPSPGPVVLGDIVICVAVARRQARALGQSLQTELRQLIAHGLLHILGRTHEDPASERAMAAEERALFEQLRMEQIR